MTFLFENASRYRLKFIPKRVDCTADIKKYYYIYYQNNKYYHQTIDKLSTISTE